MSILYIEFRHFDLCLHIGTKLPAVSGSIPAGFSKQRYKPSQNEDKISEKDNGVLNCSWERNKPSVGKVTYTLIVTDSSIFVRGWPTQSLKHGNMHQLVSPLYVELSVGTHTTILEASTCV